MPSSTTRNASIYLDHNASTPVAPEVLDAMRPYFDGEYGNPSSNHWAARGAANGLSKARQQVADLIGSSAKEVVFTGGGTEANNMALKGLWFDRRRTRQHIVTSAIEHPAIRAPIRFLKTMGAKVTIVPVDRFGRVNPDDVRKAVSDDTLLVSIMHANNETGMIQPLEQISEITQSRGALLHTDAAQTIGKIPVNVSALGVDLLSIAGHKFYAPKGVGALYIRDGLNLVPHTHGAGHEMNKRAGTENALQIVGLGAACTLAKPLDTTSDANLRDLLWELLQRDLGALVTLNGQINHMVPNTLNVSFFGCLGTDILDAIPEIAASTGSACHTGCIDMSPVLLAMRVPTNLGMGSIRFSLGRANTEDEIRYVAHRIYEVVRKIHGSH